MELEQLFEEVLRESTSDKNCVGMHNIVWCNLNDAMKGLLDALALIPLDCNLLRDDVKSVVKHLDELFKKEDGFSNIKSKIAYNKGYFDDVHERKRGREPIDIDELRNYGKK